MVSLGPKKDGGPNIDFFQSPESMQGFETIRLWLQKNCKKVCVLCLVWSRQKDGGRSPATAVAILELEILRQASQPFVFS